ncbi:MAG: S8 family serine peptidase [Parcubacteria group bacterium]|jgi:subtilisin family serine protease
MEIKNKKVGGRIVFFLLLFSLLVSPNISGGFILAEYFKKETADVISPVLLDGENPAAQRSGEILVEYKIEKIDPGTEAGAIKKNNLEDIANVSEQEKITDTVFLYEIRDNATVDEKVEELQKNSAVETAQPNYIYKSLAITPPNDTSWPSMWGLNNTGQTVSSTAGTSGADIHWLLAWDKYENDPDSEKNPVIVADIDTGFDYTHPDLDVNNLWDGSLCKDEDGVFLGDCLYGYDFDYDKKDPFDALMDTHGTMTGGIIAAAINNSTGITGISPDVKLMSLKADGQSSGHIAEFDTATIVKAVQFAQENGAKIINMSFGENGGVDILMRNAIASFSGLVIAAAGNDASDNDTIPVYPCNFSATLTNVICVGASDQNDALATFSNFGTNSVDIVAPGENIYSLYYDPDGVYHYASGDGTSFSAPYTVGLAAMLWGYDQTLTVSQVKSAILNTGDVKSGLTTIKQIDDGTSVGGRRINAYRALLLLDSDVIAPASPLGLTVD